jgi:hypothetical protein
LKLLTILHVPTTILKTNNLTLNKIFMRQFYSTLLLIISLLAGGSVMQAQTIITQPEKVAFVVREVKANYAGIKQINVDAIFCKVDIEKSPNEEVYFQGKLLSDKDDAAYQLVHEKVDTVYNISVKQPASGWTSHSGQISLYIPDGVTVKVNCTTGGFKVTGVNKANISVVTQAGSLEATNIQGSVNLETVTGETKVSNLNGQLKTKSKAGAQFIDNITGELSANSTDGDITVSKVKGSVRTESTTGNHVIGQIEGDVNSKAVNGYIKISEVVGNVKVVTFAGNIKLFNTKGLVALNSTAGEQVGTRVLLTGNSSFKSTEGKIRMQIDNKTDEVTFVCKSTNSFIQVRGQSKKKSLKFGKGKLIITSESTTGGQVYN